MICQSLLWNDIHIILVIEIRKNAKKIAGFFVLCKSDEQCEGHLAKIKKI